MPSTSNFTLTRPLIFFDMETTGTSVSKDRIIELSTLKLFVDGTSEFKTYRFNPAIPIPTKATMIHRIMDEDVADEPFFTQVAVEISNYFKGCDIGGFNITRFYVPLLVEEFLRAKVPIPFDEDTKYVDAMSIFHKMERRDLKAAYNFYCHKDHLESHSALGDVLSSFEVFKAQIKRYDLSESIESIYEFYNEGFTLVDYDRKFTRDKDGYIIFNFGAHKGIKATDKKEYLQWMIDKGDFSRHTIDCAHKILDGVLS